MSYPPPEGFPPTAPQPTASQPTVGFPAQPPAAPAYQPAAPAYQPAAPAYQPAAPAYPPPLAQISGTPYESPEARRRPTVLVLAIAGALLLVFGGLMLGLYVNERGNLSDTKTNLSDTRADLTAQVQEQKTIVTDQQAKLAEAEKHATDLDTQLKTTKTNLADVTGQRDALVPCMRRIQDAFDAAARWGPEITCR